MTDWIRPTEFPRLNGLVAIDVETRDPYLKSHGPGWCFNVPDRGYICGVGVAWGQNGERNKGYWPVRHEQGENFDPDLVFRWLRYYAESGDVTWVCHHGLYDRGWLRTEGVELKRLHDTETAGALLNEYRQSYALDSLLQIYLGRTKNQEELNRALHALDPKKKRPPKDLIWKLRPEQVGTYGEGDAYDTLDLWGVLEPLLVAEDLGRVYGLEMDLHHVLLAMRQQGIRIDFDAAQKASIELKRLEADAQSVLNSIAGYHVDVWSADSIAPCLRAAGLEVPLTPKTKRASVTANWLLAQKHPVCEAVKNVRRYSKMRTTFIDGYFLGHAINGRIHPEFKPLPRGEGGGAISGRMSSSNPNFQNLPSLDRDYEMGKLIRGLCLPDVGCRWASCDYSQQEPRLTVHYAALAGFPSAAAAVEAYCTDPDTDFHQMVADLTGLPRSQAKIMNLALIYGRGGASTCHALGLPTKWITSRGKPLEIAGDEGQAIIDEYFRRMPFVKDLSDECKRRAKRRGYIITIGGRRCRFAQDGKPETFSYGYTYKSLNALIQGSAADQTKMAMVEYYKEFRRPPIVQVHDELGLNDPDDGTLATAVQIMLDVIPLKVPMKVDVAYGMNWGEAK